MTALRERFALLVVLCLAFGVRVYRLDAQGFWYDEAFSNWIAAKDWAGILDFAGTLKLEHPPLYYLLLHAWRLATGDTEFSLRFFSLFFSVVCVALLYAFACRWFGAALGRWTILVAALSPFLVVYAQEARMYTLVLCLCIVALDQFLRWLSGDPRAWRWYTLFTVLSLGVHYYAALLLVVENIFLRLPLSPLRTHGAARPLLARWLGWNALLLALILALITLAPGPRESVALVFSHPLFTGRSVDDIQHVLVDLLMGGVVSRPLASADVAWSALLLLVAGAGALALPRVVERARAQLVWLLLIVPPLFAAAVPIFFNARYVFLSVPGLIIGSAAVLKWLEARRLLLVFVLTTFLLATGYSLSWNFQFYKSDYREMAGIVTTQSHSTDALLLVGTSQWPLATYYLRDWPQTYIPPNPETAELSDIDGAMRAVQQLHPRVWLVNEQAWIFDPADNAMRWLALNAYPVSRQWFRSNNAVSLYLSDNAPLRTQQWNVQFGDWLLLEQSALPGEDMNPGEGLSLRLRWHATRKIPQPMQLLVTLRLFDQSGRVVRERVSKPCDGFCAVDDWIVGQPVDDRHGLLLPADAASGDYTLRLEVYAPREQRSLPIRGAQVELGSSLELARIRVQRPSGQ